MATAFKLLQRRAYTFLNTNWGFVLFLLLNYWLLTSVVDFFSSPSPCRWRGGSSPHCSTIDFLDNIGGVRSEPFRAYGPIDVVYTWVNGSDPVWRKKKNHWAQKLMPTRHSSSPNATDTNSTHQETDETMSDNRYRDSEELRYSLRSLVQNAPWIRHIYLVTDNQIPWWLNLESGKLTVVPHETIFRNKSHLPVFSSPAIEANLHNIPGLSEHFIYFNDDVFLGAPVYPEDFISIAGVHKFVMAWEVPKCAPGCSDSWIGDGYCDKACNVSECNWDFPDCINGSNVIGNSGSTSSFGSSNTNLYQCSQGCPDSWLADRICDQRCNNYECGFDMGDCGMALVRDNYPLLKLTDRNTVLHSSDSSSSAASASAGHVERDEMFYYMDGTDTPRGMYNTDDRYVQSTILLGQDPFSLAVPYGTRLVYFDLRNLVESFLSKVQANASLVQESGELNASLAVNVSDVRYNSVYHSDDQRSVVHFATLLTKHHSLLVLLNTDEDHYGLHVLRPWPREVVFTLSLREANSHQTETVDFSLLVTDRDSADYASLAVPPNMRMLNHSMLAARCGDKAVPAMALPIPFSTGPSPSPTSSDSWSDSQPPIDDDPILAAANYNAWKQTNEAVASATANATAEDGELSPVLQGAVLAVDYALLAQALGAAPCERAWLVVEVSQAEQAERQVRAWPLCSLLPDWSRYAFRLSSAMHTPVLTSVNASLETSRQSFHRFLHSAAATQLLRHQHVHRLRAESETQAWVPLAVPLPDTHAEQVHLLARVLLLGDDDVPPSGLQLAEDWCPDSVARNLSVPWNREVFFLTALMEWSVPTAKSPASTSSLQLDTPATNHTQLNTLDAVAEEGNLTSSVQAEAIYRSTSVSDLQPAPELPEANLDNPVIQYLHTVRTAAARISPAEETTAVGNDSASAPSPSHRRLLSLRNQHAPAVHSPASEQEAYLTQLFAAFSLNRPDASQLYRGRPPLPLRSLSPQLRGSLRFLSPFSSPTSPSRHRRRLDTYAQSLIHVNRMYNRDFGNENRKVPAHVPHLLSTSLLQEMQSFYPAQWNKTSSNKFRSADDMQYAFSYYYYAIHRYKKVGYNLTQYLHEAVDVDGDGYLQRNEWRTLASIYYQRMVEEADQQSLYSVLSACLRGSNSSQGDEMQGEPSLRGRPSISQVMACTSLRDTLYANVPWTQVFSEPVLLSDKQLVAFEMIGDNTTQTLSQLDSVRSRRSKFVCINDNMQQPPPQLVRELTEFFLSFFPRRSRFELEEGRRNPTLYLDEYLAWRRQQESWTARIERVGRQARAWGVSTGRWIRRRLRQRMVQVVDWLEGQERDADDWMRSETLPSSPRGEKQSTSLQLFCLVVGTVLTVLLRRAMRRGGQQEEVGEAGAERTRLESTRGSSKQSASPDASPRSEDEEKKKKKSKGH